MIPKSTLEQINQTVNQVSEIAVLVGENFDSDSLASALSLYLSLLKLGKNVEVLAPKVATVEWAKYVGVDKISHDWLSRKFIISLNNVLGNVDKVTHYLEDGKLNIVVHALPGADRFTADNVSFSYDKPSVDLLVLIGVSKLEDLGNLYYQEQDLFSKTPVLFIRKDKIEQELSGLVIGTGQSTIAETVAFLIKQLDWPMDVDIANNLFLGIVDGTNNFQSPNLTADALEAAAFCVRVRNQQGGFEKWAPPSSRLAENTPLVNEPNQASAAVSQPEVEESSSTPGAEQAVQDDWLVPKIYKSSNPIR